MTKIMISGMGCKKCVAHVTEALEELNLTNINVDLEGGFATFEGTVDEGVLKEAIDDAGYDVTAIQS